MSSFADLMKKQPQAKGGNALINGMVIGKINLKEHEFFTIDAGLKYEGIVAAHEIRDLDHSKSIAFLATGEKDGYMLLSHDKAKRELNIKKIRKFYENKEPIEVKIVSQTTDGYKVLIFQENPGVLQTKETFEIGVNTTAYVSRIFSNGNINLSTAPVKVSKIKEGDIVTGTIISFNDYFVFVEINGSDLEGIIHFHDLSWDKINFPGEIIAQGQQVKLKVLKMQNKCLYLGLKQIQENPWNGVKDKIKIGEIYEGTIKAINDYELIVDLGDKIQGSVHISESSWGFKKGSSLMEDFKISDKIKVKVIDIDLQKRRIKLSLKQLLPNPFFEFAEKHKIGDVVNSVVLHDHTAYGSFVFVELVPGVDGMLHQSEMDWNVEEGIAKFTGLDKGQALEVQITNIDLEKTRISVSVKRLNPDFFEKSSANAQIGKVYNAEVTEINYEGIVVKLEEFNGCAGFIKKTEVSNDKNIRLNSFAIGDKLKAKLIAIHNIKRQFMLSIKAQQMDSNKEAIKGNQNTIATSSFGSFLNEQNK